METKEAIKILSEIKNSPRGWQSTSDAIDHVITRIKELEKQLSEIEMGFKEEKERRTIACKLLDDWEAGRLISLSTKKQLAESVPKSEIKNILKNFDDAEKDEYCFETLYKYMADEIEKLLTPPAKEDE
jgi:hypothetical protein